jgi:hypothetical protein
LSSEIESGANIQAAYYLLDRPPVDCPDLIGLTQHLNSVAVALDAPWTESFLAHDGAHLTGMRQVSHWLHLAAGLRHVEIFLMEDPDDSGYCAWDFPLDLNHLASIYMTEFTRLQYTYNAVERFLRIVENDLPAENQAGRIKRATLALKYYWDGRDLPEHHNCLVKHLRSHIMKYSAFREVDALVSAFECSAWRDESGLLLSVGSQLRHLPAHGDLFVPDPEYANFSRASSVYPKIAHVPLVGVRALLLSLQMLLIALGAASGRETANSWKTLHLQGHAKT